MRALAICVLLGTVLAQTDEPRPVADDPLGGITDPQTLSQLLQWSLDNQDLDALHRKAEAMRHAASQTPGVLSADGNEGELAAADVKSDMPGALPQPSGTTGQQVVQAMTPERREELNALASQMMPDIVGLMREALATATDESLAVDQREAALLDLEDHACDIDHARDLMHLGGFPSIVELMASEQPPLQAAAAWVIGSSVKNHRELQLPLLTLPTTMPSLLALARSHAVVQV